eukprot:scaffold666990_cov37-Prasinocladus_malaysianus.AAC.1
MGWLLANDAKGRRVRGSHLLSPSIRAMMSRLSFMTRFSSLSSRMGATFLPTRLVGVSTSSLAMKTTSCFTFCEPSVTAMCHYCFTYKTV